MAELSFHYKKSTSVLKIISFLVKNCHNEFRSTSYHIGNYTKFPPSRGKILKGTQKGWLSRYLKLQNTLRGRRLVGSRGRHLRQKHVVPGLSGLHDPCGALRSILRHPGPSATRTNRCAILRIVRDEGGDTASLRLPWLFAVET